MPASFLRKGGGDGVPGEEAALVEGRREIRASMSLALWSPGFAYRLVSCGFLEG